MIDAIRSVRVKLGGLKRWLFLPQIPQGGEASRTQVDSWAYRFDSHSRLDRSYGTAQSVVRIKRQLFAMHESGQLGRVVLDAGCSDGNISFVYAVRKGHVVLGIDLAVSTYKKNEVNDWRGSIHSPTIFVKGDIHELDSVLARPVVREFLAQNNVTSPEFDAAIFSDLLNYVNFRRVLLNVLQHMKPGGRLIINNMAGVFAEPSLRNEHGVKSNQELIKYLLDLKLEIETYLRSSLDVSANVDTDERDIVVARVTEKTMLRVRLLS